MSTTKSTESNVILNNEAFASVVSELQKSCFNNGSFEREVRELRAENEKLREALSRTTETSLKRLEEIEALRKRLRYDVRYSQAEFGHDHAATFEGVSSLTQGKPAEVRRIIRTGGKIASDLRLDQATAFAERAFAKYGITCQITEA